MRKLLISSWFIFTEILGMIALLEFIPFYAILYSVHTIVYLLTFKRYKIMDHAWGWESVTFFTKICFGVTGVNIEVSNRHLLDKCKS